MPRAPKLSTQTRPDFCPNEHKLPHYNEHNVKCTVLNCADSKSPATNKSNTARIFEPPKKKLSVEEQNEHEETTRINLAQKRLELRLKKLNVIDSDDPAEVESWADRELVKMLKIAVGDLNAQLRWGTDKERAEARMQVLNSTGRGKRGDNSGASSPIFFIVGDAKGNVQLPWMPQPKLIEAQGTVVTHDTTPNGSRKTS